jgi:ABC-type nitrate/sulfonate/bicarbonate transport system substrate-binding protein
MTAHPTEPARLNRPTRRLAWIPVLFGLAVAACGRAEPPADSSPPRLRVRVATTAGGELAEVPTMVAHRELERLGYAIEPITLAQAELVVEALGRGSADIAHGSLPAFWAGVARGVPVVTVMEPARNGHLLVGTKAISSCRDLHGRRIGVNSLGATGGTLVRAFIREECPGTTPEYLVIPGSRNRVAALMAGAIDAAALLRDDAVKYQARSTDARIVQDFAVRWPDVAMVGIYANTSFAARHPAAIEHYLRECLRAARALGADPARFAESAREYLGTDQDLLPVARAYVEARTWDGTGGLTPERVSRTIRFFSHAGWLDSAVEASALVDRSFLDRALAALDGPPSAPSEP